MPDDTGRWVARLGPGPGTPLPVRLVCVPPAGAGKGFFRPLAASMAAVADLFAVQLPGRENRRREPPLTRMDDVVAGVAGALDELAGKPVALLGYCSGAYIMLRLARHLARRPVLLFPCAAPAPEHIDPGLRVHAMPAKRLKDYLRAYRIIPDVVLDDDGLFSAFEPAIRADYQVFETAGFETDTAVLDVPVTAIAGRADPSVSLPKVLDWERRTSRAFALRVLPAGHDLISGGATDLAAVLAAELGRYRCADPSSRSCLAAQRPSRIETAS